METRCAVLSCDGQNEKSNIVSEVDECALKETFTANKDSSENSFRRKMSDVENAGNPFRRTVSNGEVTLLKMGVG